MKKVMEWLTTMLTANMDNVLHYTLGSLLAFVTMILMMIVAPVWVSVLVSFCVTMGLVIVKEYMVDTDEDWEEILVAMIGGLTVWIPFFF